VVLPLGLGDVYALWSVAFRRRIWPSAPAPCDAWPCELQRQFRGLALCGTPPAGHLPPILWKDISSRRERCPVNRINLAPLRSNPDNIAHADSALSPVIAFGVYMGRCRRSRDALVMAAVCWHGAHMGVCSTSVFLDVRDGGAGCNADRTTVLPCP